MAKFKGTFWSSYFVIIVVWDRNYLNCQTEYYSKMKKKMLFQSLNLNRKLFVILKYMWCKHSCCLYFKVRIKPYTVFWSNVLEKGYTSWWHAWIFQNIFKYVNTSFVTFYSYLNVVYTWIVPKISTHLELNYVLFCFGGFFYNLIENFVFLPVCELQTHLFSKCISISKTDINMSLYMRQY